MVEQIQPELREVAEDLWVAEGGPIKFFAPPYPIHFNYALRMVVVRLGDGSLWIDSPLEPSDALAADVAALGPVRHIVSPNKLHHLYMGHWAKLEPDALLYASPGLAEKRDDLDFHKTLGDSPEQAWGDALDQKLVRGSRFMEEVVFFHRRSESLILGDLIENHDPAILSPAQRFFARINRMLAPHGTTPLNFRLSFTDRAATRHAIEDVLAWRPRRVVMMHGPIVEDRVEEFLHHAFAWLHPAHEG